MNNCLSDDETNGPIYGNLRFLLARFVFQFYQYLFGLMINTKTAQAENLLTSVAVLVTHLSHFALIIFSPRFNCKQPGETVGKIFNIFSSLTYFCSGRPCRFQQIISAKKELNWSRKVYQVMLAGNLQICRGFLLSDSLAASVRVITQIRHRKTAV